MVFHSSTFFKIQLEENMHYSKIRKATFLKRPNRFIAHVMLDNQEEIVHVKNTGRCKEIFHKDTTVLLEESNNPNRKTKYSIIGAYKKDTLINTDAQIPNYVVYEGISENKIKEISNVSFLKKEVTFGDSRFDLYFETSTSKGFIEVKGVTLEENKIALFPDAPTQRGTKHIYEMIRAVEKGYEGYIFFLIQMKGIKYFTPNQKMDPDFADALKKAQNSGVKILAYDSHVTEEEIIIGKKIEVIL